MRIPSSFKIANSEIKVVIKEVDPVEYRYGTFCDANNTITIYKTIKIEGETYTLTEEQMLNTFCHELIHCFQFFAGIEYDEREAQMYANFLREYYASKC